jgi:hypothetical protein
MERKYNEKVFPMHICVGLILAFDERTFNSGLGIFLVYPTQELSVLFF